MTRPDELSGKVVAGVEQDDDDRVRLRFTDGTVAEFIAGAAYEDAYLDCSLFTQEDWHEELGVRHRKQVELEARRRDPAPPSPFWQGVMNDMRRDINRQPFLGESMVIPIRSRRSDVSG